MTFAGAEIGPKKVVMAVMAVMVSVPPIQIGLESQYMTMQRAAAYAAFILAALLECRATTPALFVMRSSKLLSGFALGIALFLSAADGH